MKKFVDYVNIIYCNNQKDQIVNVLKVTYKLLIIN